MEQTPPTLTSTHAALSTRIAALERADPRPALVSGWYVAHVAIPRYLIWRLYLRSRIPTADSLTRMAHLLRGHAYWRLAVICHERGYPLPVKPGVAVPHYALAKPMQPLTRAAYDDIPDDLPVEFWDTYGAGNTATPTDAQDAMTRQMRDALSAQALADVTESLAFDDWLNGVLSDVSVLQLLETYWNGQTVQQAGTDLARRMSLDGAFNLRDKPMENFLMNQAGAFVTKINERTRQDLADELWALFTLNDLSVSSIAPALRQLMNSYGNDLAGMSARRAHLITVTEVARAESFGNFVGMLRLGVQQKEWLTTTGACIICQGNESQGPIPIRDQFVSGDLASPAHPRCRCTIIPVIQDSFDPKQWSNRPDDEALDNLFNDPSFALFPRNVVDLNAPEAGLVPPAPRLLNFDDLPAALRNVLKPDVIDGLQERLGTLTQTLADTVMQDTQAKSNADFADFLNRFAALQQSAKEHLSASAPVSTSDATGTPPSTDTGVFTLDEILAQQTSATASEMTDIERNAVQKLKDALAALNNPEPPPEA